MPSAERYLESVRGYVGAITAAADGNLSAWVEHCPEYDVGRLLVHTGGFCRFVGHFIATGADWEPSTQWHPRQEGSGESDPLGWHTRWGAVLITAMENGDPTAKTHTWAGPRSRLFWYRRAAQELAVHGWDVAHARGDDPAIAADIATDGVDEFLREFGPRFFTPFEGNGETLRFETTDTNAPFHVTMLPDGITVTTDRAPADVTAAGSASDVVLFLWGRKPPSALTATGNAALLDRWHDEVKV